MKIAPQGFGGIRSNAQLFHPTKVLLVAITLDAVYTFDYEISLMLITIIGQGLQFSIPLSPLQGVCNQWWLSFTLDPHSLLQMGIYTLIASYMCAFRLFPWISCQSQQHFFTIPLECIRRVHMCWEAQSSLSPFPTPCGRNATWLAREALVWMDTPHELTIHLYHYHHLTCMKNAHQSWKNYKFYEIAATKTNCKKIKQNDEGKNNAL